MKTKGRIGFAVVGLGNIALGSVLPAFAHSKRAKLIALISRDKKRAVRLAQKSAAKASFSVDECSACLRNPAIAAVYIATPPGEHLALTIQAARAGKHILCEKPLAATVEQSAELVKACRDAGVLLMTAYRKQLQPGCRYLKHPIHTPA